MNLIDLPSPNHAPRVEQIDTLVMHYTGMPTAQAALERLQDPTPGRRVSAHYVVDEDGTVYRMVPEDRVAWHAGISSWRGQEDVNARSIGIEIVNPGHDGGLPLYPPAQMRAVAALAKDIIARHGIPSWNVVGHSDIAPDRKQDPGEHFPWEWLAEQGVGMWPRERAFQEPSLFTNPVGWVARLFKAFNPFASSVLDTQRTLVQLGYNAPLCGSCGPDTEAAIRAFQRRFSPERIDGQWNAACQARAEDLMARVPPAPKPGPLGMENADRYTPNMALASARAA